MRQQKDFTKDENAMWSAISNKLMKWHPKANMQHDRYWFVTFTKPFSFAHGKNEDVWFYKMLVWDRQQKKIIGTILGREPSPIITHQYIDFTHQMVVLRTRNYIAFYTFEGVLKKAYSVDSTSVGEKRSWECKFITKNIFLTESAGGWREIHLNTNSEYTYSYRGGIKINEHTHIIVDKETGYRVVISPFYKSSLSTYRISVWRGCDLPVSDRISFECEFIKSLNFTPLKPILQSPVAEIVLKGYSPTKANTQVTKEQGKPYLKIGNTLLCIEDFGETD